MRLWRKLRELASSALEAVVETVKLAILLAVPPWPVPRGAPLRPIYEPGAIPCPKHGGRIIPARDAICQGCGKSFWLEEHFLPDWTPTLVLCADCQTAAPWTVEDEIRWLDGDYSPELEERYWRALGHVQLSDEDMQKIESLHPEVTLDAEGAKKVVELLDNPPAPNEALEKLFKDKP